jgi:hypothetical protein
MHGKFTERWVVEPNFETAGTSKSVASVLEPGQCTSTARSLTVPPGYSTYHLRSIHVSVRLDPDSECCEVLDVVGEDGLIVDVRDRCNHRIDFVDAAFTVGTLVGPRE